MKRDINLIFAALVLLIIAFDAALDFIAAAAARDPLAAVCAAVAAFACGALAHDVWKASAK